MTGNWWTNHERIKANLRLMSTFTHTHTDTQKKKESARKR